MWQGILDPHKVKILSGALGETAAAHTIQINFIVVNEVTFSTNLNDMKCNQMCTLDRVRHQEEGAMMS